MTARVVRGSRGLINRLQPVVPGHPHIIQSYYVFLTVTVKRFLSSTHNNSSSKFFFLNIVIIIYFLSEGLLHF